MPSDKDKILRGMRFIAVGMPFIFMGPALLTWAGIPHADRGNYLWMIISIIFMILAAYFCVRGLRTILSGLFDGKA